MPNIKQSDVHYVANEAVCKFYRDSVNVLDVIFRVSNRDVAFRYVIHPTSAHLSCTITKELTQFKHATGSTTFLCPQAKPMGGFAGTSPSYETSYTLDDAMGKTVGVKVTHSLACSKIRMMVGYLFLKLVLTEVIALRKTWRL